MTAVYPTLNFDLGEEIDMLRETVHAFAQAELAPRAAEIDASNEFPMDMWKKLGDLGLLGITVKGERRFKVEQSTLRKDKLTMGKICFIDESETQVPKSYQGFSDLLREITDQYELSLAAEPERFTEANWVSNRLVDLLPFEVLAKQALLEMNNVLNRFDYMQTLLEKMDLEDQKSSFSLN